MRLAPIRRSAPRALLLAALAFVAIPAASASAGRLLITGHDTELHCSGGQQCHFVRVATDYVRAGAPDPNKPVLVLDRGALQFPNALGQAFAPGNVPQVVMDPRSPQFASAPLTTSRYSAILIASDKTCIGCDLNETDSTPDSDAINARKADIASFFNAGGGIYANAGADHGDGDASNGADTYYSFLPLPVGGKPVRPPFCLTSRGIGLGFQDPPGSPNGCPDPSKRTGSSDDINCCATHNSFQEPAAGSALQVAERDLGPDGVISGDDSPETIVAEGVVKGGKLVQGLPSPVLGKKVNVEVVRGKVRVKTRGHKFANLTSPQQISVGSQLDTSHGTVKLTTARDTKGKTQTGKFNGGIFKVTQSRKKSAKGLSELTLKGGSFSRCHGGAAGRSLRVTASRKIRKLKSNAKGRYRTRGRYSAATVRGTKWTVEDRCDGTLTRVQRGKVSVKDFKRHRTVLVRAGHSYLARAR